MAELRSYNTQTDIYFPLIKAGANDFAVSADYTPATGDVQISKDGGTAANSSNLPTAVTMGNSAMWKLTLTATEMQAGKVMVTVSDSATKAVEDQMILIETYGNASAEHAFDLDAAEVTVGTSNDKTGYALSATGLDSVVISEPSGVFAWGGTLRELLGWLGALSRNKITQTSTTQTLRNDADAANISTAAVSDDGSTFTRSEWS